MSILQIKIDDKEVLTRLKMLAKSKGLTPTSFARMRLYEEANSFVMDIEQGLNDLKDGNTSPTFTNTSDAMKWLNK